MGSVREDKGRVAWSMPASTTAPAAFALAADDEDALRRAAGSLMEGAHMGSRAFHRSCGTYRAFGAAPSFDLLISQLKDLKNGIAPVGGVSSSAPAIVLLFPGQGAQLPAMGRGLSLVSETFRDLVQRADAILDGRLPSSLSALLTAETAAPDAAALLKNTAITQPALFVMSYGLARSLEELGLAGDAFAGHSIGEFAAAVMAGVMSFEDALKLVAERGRLMATTQPGTMLAVSLPEATLAPMVAEDPRISIATVNGPRQCVVGGETEAVEAFAARLVEEGRQVKRLDVSHAFHCPLMDPILGAFEAAVAATPMVPPTRPYLSNVTGTWMTPEDAVDPGYWVRQLRGAVRFHDILATLKRDRDAILVEAGPGQALSRLARTVGYKADQIVTLLPSKDTGPEPLLAGLGRLWCAGAAIEWPMISAALVSSIDPRPAAGWQAPNRERGLL